MGTTDPVRRAIRRWEASGLIDAELAARLQEELARHESGGHVRLARLILAATAAVVVLLAGGVFVDWAWPRLGEAGRAWFLLASGLVLYLAGYGTEARTSAPWTGRFMQLAGLGLSLSSAVYATEVARADTGAGLPVALAATLLASGGMVLSTRRHPLAPAAHFAFLLPSLALALRAWLSLPWDNVVWVLDGILFTALAALGARLARPGGAGEAPPAWTLPTFLTGVYAGFILVLWTGAGPLDLQDQVVWPLDVWWALMVALTLWSLHRGPAHLRGPWASLQLAASLLLWIPLAFWTGLESLDGPPEVVMALLVGPAVAAFWYAQRHRLPEVSLAAAVPFVVGLWYWAAERGGAPGVVLALAATGAGLFYLSARWSPTNGDRS